MKQSQDKKTYLLLPDLLKQAKLKSDRDKQNVSFNGNRCLIDKTEKILLSQYLQANSGNQSINSLKNTISLRANQSEVQSSETSFKSEGIFNEDDFLSQEIKELRTNCADRNGELKRAKISVDLRKDTNNMLLSQQHTVNLKQPMHKQDPRSSDKKRRNSFLKKVLQDIKNNRNESIKPPQSQYPSLLRPQPESLIDCSSSEPTLQPQPILKHPLSACLDFPLDSQSELEPVLSLVEQMVSSESIFFDPDKFEEFLRGLKHNTNFQKALKAFIYSYYLQNEMKD